MPLALRCLGSEDGARGCWVSLNGFLWVFGVEKLRQGVKGHPVSAALFLGAGDVNINNLNVYKAKFLSPATKR